jgi:hypothetical protein
MGIKKSNIIPTLIVMGWFGILLIVATIMTSCEKHDDCKLYRCGSKEVNVINHAAYYQSDNCECIEKFK